MSTRRDLKNAQQVLNDAVCLWANDHSYDGVESETLMDAWRAFDAIQRDLDGDAAASGRDTSIAAAKTRLPTKGSLRRRIIECVLAHHSHYGVGMTVDALEVRLKRSHQSVSSAMNYAEEHGWLKDSGQRAETRSSRPDSKIRAIVYEPTALARQRIVEAITHEED